MVMVERKEIIRSQMLYFKVKIYAPEILSPQEANSKEAQDVDYIN